MRTVINACGKEIDFEIAVEFMNDDLREKIHRRLVVMDSVSDQKFFDIYCRLHRARYNGEEFFLNEENPQY